MKHFADSPKTKPIDDLMNKLYDHITEMETLQEDLAEAIECYEDETDDAMTEMGLYLDDALKSKDVNEMLYMELNAGRKELMRLISCLKENGIVPPGERYIHYDRLKPDFSGQDPDSPFYPGSPDEYFRSLLQGQYEFLREFEKNTPMTTAERGALRMHVIHDTDLQSGSSEEWLAFLKGYRAFGNKGGKQ